jgi:hypothetical protein
MTKETVLLYRHQIGAVDEKITAFGAVLETLQTDQVKHFFALQPGPNVMKLFTAVICEFSL